MSTAFDWRTVGRNPMLCKTRAIGKHLISGEPLPIAGHF